jgi:hypothetical protein
VFLRHFETEIARKLACLGLGLIAKREAQKVELRARGGEQEIALVAAFLAGAIERTRPIGKPARRNIVPGRQNLGAKFTRRIEQIAELDGAIAVDAWHRRLARHVTLRKTVDHRFLEAAFIVEHVVRNADLFGDAARIVNVVTGAAGALAVNGGTMIVELQGHADDIVAFGFQHGRSDRRIDTAGHGNDHARVLRPSRDV